MTQDSAAQVSSKKNFEGRRVIAFESRMADTAGQMIQRFGGSALVAPSLQEIPLERNPEALAFGEKLMAGGLDMIILLTGVGTRMLMRVLETRWPREEIIKKFSRMTLVARGPKPVQALRELGLTPTVTVPEPNTWFEVLETLDLSKESISLEGRTVAVQEYGISNPELLLGLKKRGARVVQVPVYRWALPDDLTLLQSAVDEIAAGKADFVLFTNAMQVRHVLRVAAEKGVEEKLRKGLHETVVVSIGPTCSETLRECGLSVDYEPTHAKLGQLISETAQKSQELLQDKKTPLIERPLTPRVETADDKKKRLNSPFMKACRREAVPYTPVWLMRQAGRYMKEYRRIRDRVSFLELCKNPELCAEVTITAREKLGVDAAILFSDILLIVEPLGLGLDYLKGDGPVISSAPGVDLNVDELREIEPEETLSFVFDAVRMIRSCMSAEIPLIGFSGAPFTLASYIIEGGSSKAFLNTKKLMLGNPGAWHALMQKLSRGLIKYLNLQIDAGADAVQIFDSWAGCLGPEEYREFVLPHSREIIRNLKPGVPVIHFGTGTGTFLKDFTSAGGDVVGVDFKISLDDAWKIIGYDRAIQGNLDPAVLFTDIPTVRAHAKRILEQAGNRPGHIFNLGHGIMPATPVDHVRALVDFVHEVSQR